MLVAAGRIDVDHRRRTHRTQVLDAVTLHDSRMRKPQFGHIVRRDGT